MADLASYERMAIKPEWESGDRTNRLTAASRACYRRIGLHFHDLRREFGSRVLESGSSLVEARDLLGHANISQTSTYLQSTAKSTGGGHREEGTVTSATWPRRGSVKWSTKAKALGTAALLA